MDARLPVLLLLAGCAHGPRAADTGIADLDDRCPLLLDCYPGEWGELDGCPDPVFAVTADGALDPAAARLAAEVAEEARLLGGRLGELVVSGPGADVVGARLVDGGVAAEKVRVTALDEPPGTPVRLGVERCEATAGPVDWWRAPAPPCSVGARPRGITGVEVTCVDDGSVLAGRTSWWWGQRDYYEGTYRAGRRHGRWEVWRDGRRVATADYRDGALVEGSRLWSRDDVIASCPPSSPGADCDGDGVPAARDLCLALPEDIDGWRDEDGCPEPDVDDACAVEDPACPAAPTRP